MPRRFELVENPLRGFPPVFAVCCAHIVDTPDTMFHFPQAGNSTCLRVSPLPIKRVSALWGPLSASRQIPHLQPEKCFVHVQAAAKNDLDTVLRIRGELCEAFLTVLHIGGAICSADFHTYVYSMSVDFLDDLRFGDRNVDGITAYPFRKGYLRQFAAVV